ncbi:alpha/beta hydrolase fold domain protein [Mycobacterium sp. MAC_080597_8934]|nr:alpha/beta hydrolase fold domain protein [Mycobacterium sp. MAC_080597_8934]
MPAQVDGDRLPPARGDGGGRLAPRPPRLPATVQEHHGARPRIPETVGDDLNAAGAADREGFGCHGHQVILRRPPAGPAVA